MSTEVLHFDTDSQYSGTWTSGHQLPKEDRCTLTLPVWGVWRYLLKRNFAQSAAERILGVPERRAPTIAKPLPRIPSSPYIFRACEPEETNDTSYIKNKFAMQNTKYDSKTQSTQTGRGVFHSCILYWRLSFGHSALTNRAWNSGVL